MTRYSPARYYLGFATAALALAGGTAWFGLKVTPVSFVASALFVLTAALLYALGLRPSIEVHETYLLVGKRMAPWMEIRAVDRTGWIAPLIVRLGMADGSRIRLIYPGDLDSCNSLLRHIRRLSRDATIDGTPYRQYWGEMTTGNPRKKAPPVRYRILRPEDEAEVEKLYQRLKTVGNLDQKNHADEP